MILKSRGSQQLNRLHIYFQKLCTEEDFSHITLSTLWLDLIKKEKELFMDTTPLEVTDPIRRWLKAQELIWSFLISMLRFLVTTTQSITKNHQWLQKEQFKSLSLHSDQQRNEISTQAINLRSLSSPKMEQRLYGNSSEEIDLCNSFSQFFSI